VNLKERWMYEFDQFPRGSLALKRSRRRLWSGLVRAMQIAAGESQGGRAYPLAELGNWSDAQLAGIVPVVLAGCHINVQERAESSGFRAESSRLRFVMALPPGARQPLKLFPLDTPALAVYNRMNGQISLEANARCLEHETGWSAQRCFAYVRGLFLWLILARVCVPKEQA
jgi:hypothetical protein